MISKAKILFYAAFKKSRPPLESEGKKKLNFLNKLVLLQVRRFKRYGEIPAYLGHYEWHQSLEKAKTHYKILGLLVMLYFIHEYQEYRNLTQLIKAKELLKKREEKGLPEYPLWDLFGDNPYFNYKNADFYNKEIEQMSKDSGGQTSFWSKYIIR